MCIYVINYTIKHMVRIPKPPEGNTNSHDQVIWTNLPANTVAGIPYRVHERYLHHKTREPLTIRFLGTLNFDGQTPGTWIGVEYDDATKGKHNGVFQGYRTFPVKQAGAGAFIKHSPDVVLEKGRTFVEAFEERYGPIDPSTSWLDKVNGVSEAAITLGSSNGAILVEAPGLDRVKQNIGKLERLREVGLEGEWVYTLGASEAMRGVMRERLKGVTSINMSRSLLSSWEAVGEIIDCLPSLQTIVLNQTRLRSIDSRTPAVTSLDGITELHLGRSAIIPLDILTIARLVPRLKRLYLNNNTTLDRIPGFLELENPFDKLQSLDISGCGTGHWSALCSGLAQLPALETLNISKTPLTSLPLSLPNDPALPHLRSLIWLEAQIHLLPDLDALQSYLPDLRTLRFSPLSAYSPDANGRPAGPTCLRLMPPGASEEYEQTTLRPMIIAKFPSLLSLNSTPISAQERRDAELWYISHIRRLLSVENPETTPDQWGQFDQLCAKHVLGGREGRAEVKRGRETSALKSKLITLTVVDRTRDTAPPRIDIPVLPSAGTQLFIRKIEKALGLKGIAVWSTRTLDGETDKLALIDGGKVGDWLETGDEVWVEPA